MGKKKPKREKITTQTLLSKMKYDFSRDAEWFKRTSEKIAETKEDLNKNFYDENKKKEKIDFINKLKDKLKDYKDAIKFEARYKKVRFVERRKLERKLNHINKNIENEKDEEKLKELNEEREKIIDDINYVKFYPKTYKYYSLFPNKDAENEKMIKKREKMKLKIKFFLNGKKNKGNDHIIKNQKNEIKNLEESDNESEKVDENDNDNDNSIKKDNNEVKEEKEEKEEKKVKMNKKKDKKEKKEIESGQDYESFGKKKVFKDNFFELDE